MTFDFERFIVKKTDEEEEYALFLLTQRVAGGGIAMEKRKRNGLPRANGNADEAEYGRRREHFFVNKKCRMVVRKWARDRQAGWHRRIKSNSCPSTKLISQGTGFFYVYILFQIKKS